MTQINNLFGCSSFKLFEKTLTRALELWAKRIEYDSPEKYSADNRSWNLKKTVVDNLVESKYPSTEIKTACIQTMINACHRLMIIRPEGASELRIT